MSKKTTYLVLFLAVVALGALIAGLVHHYIKATDQLVFWDILLIYIVPIGAVIGAVFLDLFMIKDGIHEIKRVNDTLQDNFDRMENSLKLIDAIVPNISEEIAKIHSAKDVVMEYRLNKVISYFGRAITRLRKGHFYEYEPDNFYKFAVEMFHFAEKEIKATSIVHPDFWLTADGISYLAYNKKKIQEGIEIHRFFLFNSLPTNGERSQFKKIIQNQLDAGVDVKVVQIPQELQKDAYTDIGLIDDKLAIFDTYDPETKRMLKCDCWYVEEDNIDKARTIFTALESLEDQKDSIIN